MSSAYLWVKAFHLIFVISWFAGLFYLPRLFVNLASVPADSHAERTSPALESTSSDEPTLTTMRRKSLSAGRFMDAVECYGMSEPIRASLPIWKWRER